ncbi:hypothetical protein [Pseudomonas sp. GWSMS-1]|uniref:hypothetical protein n=1 Tax=Pseudomonas sp. GWSMS-1 TaxID=3308997 RepID=UPI003CF7FC4B
MLVGLVTDDVTASPRIQIANVLDPRSAPEGGIAVICGGSEQIVGRPGWRYEFRSPVLSAGGYTAKPQALLFLDADTVAFSVHLDDTESRVYKLRLSDGALLGEFTFGTSTYQHIATFARRSNGDVWASDYDTNKLLRLDLEASFSSGAAVILDIYDTTALAPYVGSIEFVTVSGAEYLLLALFSTTETGIATYVIPASLLGTSIFTIGQEFKRFDIGRRIQGIAMRSGKMMVTRNALYGTSGAVNGYIQEIDIVGAITSLPTNSRIDASVNPTYLTGQWFGPSSYVEDVAIHPITNCIFVPTEGAYAVADEPGFLALWSSDLSYEGVRNDYVLEHDGEGQLKVSINGRLFGSYNLPLSVTAGALVVGGPPAGGAGFSGSFTTAVIANVLVQNQPLSIADRNTLFSGGYELRELKAYGLTLANPGAEAGNTSGWTVELGGMTVRQATPGPFNGAYYFTGGSFVQSVSRQRLSLLAQGLQVAELDSGLMWAKVRWKQSAYSDQDPGGMGLRMLNASAGTISTNYSPFAWTLGGGGAPGPWYWQPRSFPVLVPPGTRSIDALYNASGRTSGTANDFYVDDIEVTVYSK